ncbi:hypothetical protein P171DRAFT_496383 [Karstenula rhodostoma CBS 690.94]|uniref:Uncharacterized protein n=1 Tax=Karstenula rhodostoma CBS 690.94 TaxID=1392251 RepID=A0A9P4UAH7_9PLEO|nr:hypothetical protein P171DRAFT_496383 [Karstenula rhodostoma CBS 690.94]
MTALTLNQQYEYLTACGAGTAFAIDREKTPKAEFNRLAKHYLGWEPAGIVWCTNWKACFGEDYIWRGRGANNVTATRTAREPWPSPSLGSISSDTSTVSSTSSDTASSGVVSSGGASPVPPVPRGRPLRRRHEHVLQHFNQVYGTNYRDLDAWRQLCVDVGIDPVPTSINKCKKALAKVYINIYDFVAGRPRRFGTLSELKKYSITNNKIYPLAEAKEDTFHRALLHVFFPGKAGKNGIKLH